MNSTIGRLATFAALIFAQVAWTSDVVPLAETIGFRILGAEASGSIGFIVSGAGDVNGDGYDDVLVSANKPFEDGAAFVVFGKPDSDDVYLESLESGGFHIEGFGQLHWSGSTMAGVGDVNGDGLDDVLIGSPFADPAGIENAGRAFLVFGKQDSAAVDLTSLAFNGFRVEGTRENDLLSTSVSGVGDFNNDGLDDFVLGAHTSWVDDMDYAGRVYVVFGKSDKDPVLVPSLDFQGIEFTGAETDDTIGYSTSGAGDVNGDGYPDIALGAPFGRSLGAAGRTYVLYGGPDRSGLDLRNLEEDDGFVVEGELVLGLLGRDVSGAGDINADGRSDVIAGAANSNRVDQDRPGKTHVIMRTASKAIDVVTITGISNGDNSGRGVGGVGDIDGDGFFDFGIGAIEASNHVEKAGEIYLINGREGLESQDLAMPSDPFTTYIGDEPFDQVGRSVSNAGDVNGDGITDFIVGVPNAHHGSSPNVGLAYVVYGGANLPSQATYLATAPGGANINFNAVGVIGNGADARSPASQVWTRFDDGDAASTQTVTILRSTDTLVGLEGIKAGVGWIIHTDRSNWSSASIKIRFATCQILGMNKQLIRIATAPNASGPWVSVATVIDESRNHAIADGLSEFGHFALVDSDGLFYDGAEGPGSCLP
ncbi:MAG: hypothetical protein DHS20C11_24340 [Lysobacteraceae bacterium]|nr:MAG: hypothetical protein DHS20C11_24340 [Xanthomonadaceae bacterium]